MSSLIDSLSEQARSAVEQAGKSLRTLLIFPPGEHSVTAMYYDIQRKGKTWIGYRPPLGIMYIASYLQKNSPHQARIVDANAMRLGDDDIRNLICRYQPHVVGISAWTEFWYDVYHIIQIVKNVSPDIHVCLGGPHTAIYPEITLESSGCDSIVIGDGEVPFLWLVNGLSNGYVPAVLPGLHLKVNGVKRGALEKYIYSDLDTLPFPNRAALDYNLYTSVVGKNNFATTMITTRGCPFRCTFCNLTFQKTLSRSAENVLDEMEAIAALGIREIEVYDDTFGWSKERVINICKGIIERGLYFDWSIRDRVSNASHEIISWLARAGCRRIHYGVESGSDQILKTINKGITTKQAENAVRMAKEAGIEVLTYFMLGLPGETLEDINQTIRFAQKLDPDYATFSIMVLNPGTKIYEDALRTGIVPVDFWSQYIRNPIPDFQVPYFWEETFTKEQLWQIRNKAIRSFYFRPAYLVKQLRSVQSLNELYRKGSMGLKLIQSALSRPMFIHTKNQSEK